MALKLPESFIRASATVSAKAQKVEASQAPKTVTARIDMSAEVAGAGLCPECKSPMKSGFANGEPILYCLEHRIAIPTADAAENPAEV